MASPVSSTVLFALVVLQGVNAAVTFNPDLDHHWNNFKRTFRKQYNGGEEATRRLIWESHVSDITKHNLEYDLGIHSYRRGLNEYADLHREEFVKQMNGFKGSSGLKSTKTFKFTSNEELPSTVDWREKGFVTEVMNQGVCASCYAFSTTGSVEGQHMKATGKLVSLSQQNIVDCSKPEGNLGCQGGTMDQAFTYIKNNRGIDTEASYPYAAKDGTCQFKKDSIGATVTGFVDIPRFNEDALKKAVATIGPISVGIDASHLSFLLYKDGVYNEPDCDPLYLDHAVLAIGYGTENGADYWLIKNSWGPTWGEKGYGKMSRNLNNQCGIATNASYPLI